jgi:hypothetical protein
LGGLARAKCWSILRHFGLFMTVWSISGPFDIFYGHLVYFMVIC